MDSTFRLLLESIHFSPSLSLPSSVREVCLIALSKHPCLPSSHWPAWSLSNTQSDRVTGLSKPINSFLLLFWRKPSLSSTWLLCLPDLVTSTPPHSGRVLLSWAPSCRSSFTAPRPELIPQFVLQNPRSLSLSQGHLPWPLHIFQALLVPDFFTASANSWVIHEDHACVHPVHCYMSMA